MSIDNPHLASSLLRWSGMIPFSGAVLPSQVTSVVVESLASEEQQGIAGARVEFQVWTFSQVVIRKPASSVQFESKPYVTYSNLNSN